MRKLFKVAPLFVLIIILLNISIVSAQDSVPFVPEKPDTQDWADKNAASIVATAADIAATNAAWASVESRSSVKSAPLPSGPAEVPQNNAAEIIGPSGSSAAGAPNAQADAVARQQFPEAWQKIEQLDMVEDFGMAMDPSAAEGTAGVFDSHYGNRWGSFWRSYPYKTVGILRYQDVNNNNFYCSASVISPNNVIVTAAHCLYDTVNNRWHKNWRFYPAERNLATPYGSFPWVAAQIMPAYINLSGGYNSSWARYDVGLIRLGKNSAYRHVRYYTGWLGRTWGRSCPMLLTTIGYPANLLNGSRYTYINYAECYNAGTGIFGQGSNFKGGSSGSPWINTYTPYSSGPRNYVNSVVSGGPTSASLNYMWGPQFLTSNIVWLCNQAIINC